MAAARAAGAGAQIALRRCGAALRDVIYPPQCLACDARVMEAGALCAACWPEAPFVRGLACDACGAPLPGEETQATRCDDCRRIARPWSRGRTAFLYAGAARRMALMLKHGDRLDLARPLGGWMAARAGDLAGPETLVAPVPLHRTRLLARRYNQSALLGAEVARRLGADWCPDLLVRTRRTPSLGGLGAEAREAALGGAIAPHPRRAATGRDVLLVDDVMTSGATLAASARAALAGGARRVDVVTLARAARDA